MKTQLRQGAKFVAPGQGSTISINGSDHIRKISGEDTNGTFAFVEIVLPPEGGLPPHVHSREDALFYVLEGSIQVVLGTRTYQAAAGTLAYLPRGIAHTLHNNSGKTARVVALIAPPDFVGFFDDLHTLTAESDVQINDLSKLGKNYGLEFGEDRLTQFTGPNAMGEYGLVVTAAEGRCIPYEGGSVTILLDAEDTGGILAAGVTVVPPAGTMPIDLHQTFDTLFYVLDGEFEFQVEDRSFEAPRGSTISVPRGMAHQFHCTSPVPGRLLTCRTPAGSEEGTFQMGAGEAERMMAWKAMPPMAARPAPEVIVDLLPIPTPAPKPSGTLGAKWHIEADGSLKCFWN